MTVTKEKRRQKASEITNYDPGTGTYKINSTKAERNGGDTIIGTTKAMRGLFQKINAFAGLDMPICIQGESGTGKELVARALHFNGGRSDHKFSAVNCGGIPDTLLESTLFGSVKGAFTGAEDKIGEFENANGGTLFLDEICEMPPQLQAKLLRVLQEKKVKRVGDTREHNIDVRIITATNKDLAAEVEKGRFRKDLYYRINVVPLLVPRLRERLDDMPYLAVALIEKYKSTLSSSGIKVEDISGGALYKLVSYKQWPGNIRQLESVIQRAMVLAGQGTIEVDHIKFTDAEFQKAVIDDKLRRTGKDNTGEGKATVRPRIEVPASNGSGSANVNTAVQPKPLGGPWYKAEGGVAAVMVKDMIPRIGNYYSRKVIGEFLRTGEIFSLPLYPLREKINPKNGEIAFLTPASLPLLFNSSGVWKLSSEEVMAKIKASDGFNSFVDSPFMITNQTALMTHNSAYKDPIIIGKAVGTLNDGRFISLIHNKPFVLDEKIAHLFVPHLESDGPNQRLEELKRSIREYYEAFKNRVQLY